jgi:hypothetical protein
VSDAAVEMFKQIGLRGDVLPPAEPPPAQPAHRFTRWYWTTLFTPSNPPMAMTGWWGRCTCCPVDRATYVFDAEATEQGRRWWERRLPVPVRFGASALRPRPARENLLAMAHRVLDSMPPYFRGPRSPAGA